MIALVRVTAPPAAGGGTEELGTLPDPPGSRYTAFAVHCREVGEVRETLDWYRAVLASRPAVPLGLIAPDTEVIEPIAALDHSLAFVMNPARLNGGGLPVTALAALLEAGIEGRILEEIVAEHGPEVLVHGALIRAVIARAVAGGTCGRAARDLGVHPDTLARRLNAVGLAPRLVRQRVRVRAYELRTDLGVERSAALVAGGWTSHQQRRKAVARLRQR